MKQQVPPAVVALVFAVVAAVVIAWFWRGSAGGAQSAEVEKTIQGGVAGMGAPVAPPSVTSGGGPPPMVTGGFGGGR
ncbi:MAG: hypothetical protein IT208_18070 [Chthonomonadales bacterium]|nr:hypothetical protein [Chthonomonadales bacterium]